MRYKGKTALSASQRRARDRTEVDSAIGRQGALDTLDTQHTQLSRFASSHLFTAGLYDTKSILMLCQLVVRPAKDRYTV